MKKKKKFPFYSKVAGGSARRRADRKAMQRGGEVEPLSPNAPIAPAAGAVRQKFQRGGVARGEPGDAVEYPESENEKKDRFLGIVKRKAGGVAKRQYGGRLPLSEKSWRERAPLPTPQREPLPNVELERPSVKELDVDLRPSVKEVGPPKRKVGGHITTAQRKALPSGEFALPGKGKGAEGKGPGAYPIDTPGRARNALSRGAQHASPGELATIKRKVHAKYPGIGQK